MKTAVILAGGLGTRLKPFTQVIPKPLLPIGEKSVLQIQIERLGQAGFGRIFIATNYMSEYVKSFIGNGDRFGVSVIFSQESIPLGTCGPLSLLRNELTEPFIVMNGDILSTIDFANFYNTSLAKSPEFVVVTKKIRTPFNFGSVEVRGDLLTNVVEKPDLELEIVAGIYFMKPSVLRLVPDQTYYGIDHLIHKMLENKLPVGRFLMREYWLDIGRIEDYNEAQQAYQAHFRDGGHVERNV